MSWRGCGWARRPTRCSSRRRELHKKLDRYAYGAPTIRFAEEDIDQARAAGVIIEFEHAAPIIVDRGVYRELCKAAIKRTVTELEAQVAAREQERKASRQRGRPADPVAEAQREERRQLRELAQQAHGVNLDVGAGLLTGLSTVDPTDITVARFFVYALLGSDHDGSPYTATGERVARLAASGIRLVIEQFRTDATKTRKDGTPGQTRIQYTDPHDLDGARSSGCGGSSTGPGRPVSSTAARWWSSAPSSTPAGWSSPRASGPRQRRGRRTRITPARRCTNWPRRICRPAWRSCARPWNALTRRRAERPTPRRTTTRTTAWRRRRRRTRRPRG